MSTRTPQVSPHPPAGKPRERGYAILFIFLLAAMISIALYTAAPRVAFESQRDREQLLVDRGEQYKRAIQLYFRKFRKYPAKMEDLENTSGQRFLRQKYIDPMTGKNEWRLIHVGPGGIFTDSLTQKNNGAKKQDPASVNNFITELKPISGSDTGSAQGGVNVALRKRPSDQGGAGGTNEGVDQAFNTGESGGAPSPEGMMAGNGTQNNGSHGAETPGTEQQEGREFENSLPPNETPALAASNNTGSGYPNPTGFGQSVTTNPQTGTPNTNPNVTPNGPGAFPGARNSVPGQPPNGPDLIRNILTSPRPGGPPPGVGGNSGGFSTGGSFPTPQSATAVTGANRSGTSGLNAGTSGFNNPGTTVGGGIAGVASLAERPGIKIYADHKKYNEWEFIYDFGKDSMFGGQGGQGGQVRNNQNNQQPGTGFGNSNNSSGSNNSSSNNSTGTNSGTTTTPTAP